MLQKVIGVKGCIQLYEILADESSVYYVMERPEMCVDLFDLVASRGGLSEEQTRMYFRHIVEATEACHLAGVLHRDLKEENVLVNLNNGTIKLIDFGSGALLREDDYTDCPGTEVFFPPEFIVHGKYRGVPAEVWSLGVLLFSMTCNHVPFHSTEDICRGQLQFPATMSASLKHLISSMLSMKPSSRPTVGEILKHEWFNEGSDT